VNYDNSLVVTITVTCYSWAPSSGDHSFSCGTISRPPQVPTGLQFQQKDQNHLAEAQISITTTGHIYCEILLAGRKN